MGLFDFFKKKQPSTTAPRPDAEDKAAGWEAITATFEALYPDQTNPPHRAPLIHRMHDLSEKAAAFDGISAYDAGHFWHLVSYGLTELYGKENDDRTTSGFGFELTLRVPRRGDRPPLIAFDLLESIGKAVWAGGNFALGHTIKTGPIDGRPDTLETALLVLRDPAVPASIDTPHGKVDFLMLLAVSDDYRQKMMASHDAAGGAAGWERAVVDELRVENPDLITSLREP